MGKTGLSCAKYLAQDNQDFVIYDTRQNPPELPAFLRDFPDHAVYLKNFPDALYKQAKLFISSPGISLQSPFLQAAKKKGIPIIGDIELFARQVSAPVIGITGSNGKSTVASLVEAMAQQANCNVLLGGNIGTPALDLLANPEPDFYILELSSFQLETTETLALHTACILNVSLDHMDRYSCFANYIAAKQRIFKHADHAVINRDDRNTMPIRQMPGISFGANESDEYSIHHQHLVRGDEIVMPVSELGISGQHNYLNALAALAIGELMGLEKEAMRKSLRKFQGLAHRCQCVGKYQGVSWYNDSKATNVSAAIAALKGLGEGAPGKIIWIGGGLGKGADFSPLQSILKKYVRHALLIGQDAEKIAKIIPAEVPFDIVSDLSKSVRIARDRALLGDRVLLAPACSSLDNFQDFKDRGRQFSMAIKQVFAEGVT